MKKAVVILIVLVMAVGAMACFAGCDFEEDKEPVATSYVSMEINPSLRFVLDENKKITSYSSENDDALILMYGENVVGMEIGRATQKLVDLAVKTGYLTEDNCAVAVSVSSDDEKVESEILKEIGSAVNDVNQTTAFDVKYDPEGSFILRYQLAKLKENHAGNEYYQNLTAGKLRLINSAMTVDLSLRMDVAVKMTTQELLAIVDNAYAKLDNFSTKAFKGAVILAEQAYQKSVITAQEAVYLAKYMEYKGIIEGGLASIEYGGLVLVAKSIQLIAKGVTLTQNLTNKVLANEDVIAIATHLKVNVEVLKDENGDVTVESIGAYVDKIAKNNADKLTQDMRDKLTVAVDKLEKSKENLQDRPLSQEIVSQIKTLLESIEIKDIELINITVEDLNNIASKLVKQANDVMAEMDASLTAEQKQSIVKAQQQAVDRLSGARAQYNQAVAKAEQDAKKFLQDTKNARLEFLAQQSK